jgi:hypothetical protein
VVGDRLPVSRSIERERQQREGKSLGELVSELLASALDREETETVPFTWITQRMRARVDLEDKEVVRRALEEP